MSKASTEIPRDSRSGSSLEAGIHAAYLFETQSEKQAKLFSLCRDIVDARNSSLIYIAGKQGVKGIRLSLKDIGFDVSFFERTKQLKIVDSEEWFLSSSRQQQFKSLQELEQQLASKSQETTSSGFAYLAVISETDMLVRKGFLSKYREFDNLLTRKVRELRCAFVCAFDRRELVAAGVPDVDAEISSSHSRVI